MSIFKRNQPQQETISAEEQLLRRQSAPRATAMSEAQRLYQEKKDRAAQSGGVGASPSQGVTQAPGQVVGREQVLKATQTLNKYKAGKANLETKIVENEQWYKVRHWSCMRDQDDEVQPSSAWLFNSIANKHADAMDNYPSPNVLPREEGDKGEAERLTSIIPVVLDQCNFEEVYSDEQNYKIKTGCGAYGVFWDSSRLNGLGDISVTKVDLINLFWESGINDIQKSRNVFHVELMDNDLLMERYPQLQNKLGGKSVTVSTYIYDDTVDTTEKSAVVDWYYKKSKNGRTVLHYCKFVNDEVLYASENDPNLAERGWYDHGLYPFVVDPLFKIEGSIAGFGYVDIGKDAQAYIDRGNQAIMKNMLANAAPRHFIRTDGTVNEEEYADYTKPFVHVDGSLGQDSVLPIQGKPLDGAYVTVITNKIDELKETTGNRDISTGGTTSGVTAASAIAAMQEAGSKLSRDSNKASFRAFRKVCEMIVELIRQFYDMPRTFRILGEDGMQRYISYSNAGIKPQHQGNDFGQDMGYRLPLFDIEITAQKQSPYSKMAQNELALQFYNAGFFNPEMSDQALACLDMMDFPRKSFIMQKISENGTMHQQIIQLQQQMIMLAQMVDQAKGTNLADQIAAGIMGGSFAPVDPMSAPPDASQTEALGGEEQSEAANTKKARQRVAESTSPT